MRIAIPLITTVVALVFSLTVLDQYLERRRPYQLVWTVGLGLYTVASLLQLLWSAGVASEAVFRLWYLTGAMLVAAYLGMGTIYLLFSPKAGHITLGVLLLLTLLAAALALATPLRADVGVLEGGPLLSQNPNTRESLYPAYVGALTAFLNSAGALVLIGGAVYSAVVFALRRAAPHRVVSNILIAVGALVSAAGGALERFNLPQPHSLALLIGIVVIYVGFLRSREVFSVYRVPFRRRPGPA
ncbi:MAG: hypothetical protein HY686_08565 [Chloroflexi bacterium]|nr:hypothetical protein [Chloroflexota bacterium]